jgi:hypothetical protein
MGRRGSLVLLHALVHVPSAAAFTPYASEVHSWLCGEGFRARLLHRVMMPGPAAGSHCRDLLLVHGRPTPSSRPVSILLHLVATPRAAPDVVPAEALAQLTDAFSSRHGGRLIHLWEDQWSEHPSIVRSRLLAMLGTSRRLWARQTTAQRIDQQRLDAFLLENHLWGPTKARYRLGLFLADELVAVASFSPRWNVRFKGDRTLASHELIRYCSRRGETVVGGISKLIRQFEREAAPDEIVTVIDRDWGDGKGWASLGFRPLKRLPAVTFYVGPDGRRCHLNSGPNPYRRRLPPELAKETALLDGDEAGALLGSRGYFAVRDAGAERHLLALHSDRRAPAAAC